MRTSTMWTLTLISLLGLAMAQDEAGDPTAFSQKQDDALLSIGISFSAISFIGSSWVCATYALFPDMRTPSFTFVFWLSFTDIMTGIGFFIGNPQKTSSPACVIQGMVFQQFFTTAGFFWTVVIAHYLYQTILKQRALKDDGAQMKKYHTFVWTTSFLLAVLPFSTSDYGNTGAWCWIGEGNTASGWDTAWRFLSFYIPLWMCVIYNSVVYYKVTQFVKITLATHGNDPDIKKLIKFIDRLKWYPIILVITYGWATVNRLQNSINPNDLKFWLFCLHTMFQSMLGSLNALAYGSNPNVRAAWVGKMVEWGLLSERADSIDKSLENAEDGSGLQDQEENL